MGAIQILYVLLQFPLCIPVGIYLIIEKYVFWVRYQFKVSFLNFWKYYDRTKKKEHEKVTPNGDSINGATPWPQEWNQE